MHILQFWYKTKCMQFKTPVRDFAVRHWVQACRHFFLWHCSSSVVGKKYAGQKVPIFRQRAANFRQWRSRVLKISILSLNFPKMWIFSPHFAFLNENFRTIFRQPKTWWGRGGNCSPSPVNDAPGLHRCVRKLCILTMLYWLLLKAFATQMAKFAHTVQPTYQPIRLVCCEPITGLTTTAGKIND